MDVIWGESFYQEMEEWAGPFGIPPILPYLSRASQLTLRTGRGNARMFAASVEGSGLGRHKGGNISPHGNVAPVTAVGRPLTRGN